jgi:isopenicillin-N N-acyltransferase like protein
VKPEIMKILGKILKWFLLAIVTIVIVFICWFLLTAIDHPPKVKDLSALATERQRFGENTYFVGNNWLRKSESGLWEMYIEGDPFDRGVAFGKLTSELLSYQESVFIGQIKKLVPSESYLKFLKYFTAWFDRNLDENIPEEYKEEIYGTSFACSPEYDFIGSGYQRQLNYHAAHDIGHALKGLKMVGCTSFSCWNGKSADSTLIIGRNFDFFMGPEFAENKIVCFYNPSSGHKFMMVSWADMIGVVSGMNEKGLTVTINAAKSSIPLQASTPVTILAREILQYAENIDQAYAIALKRKLFVSESILIGSVNDGKSAIIEKSPDKIDIVYPDTCQIICSNHYQGKAFLNDKANIENILGSDSKCRFDRVKELLSEKGKIDVPGAVSILRNRFGSGNSDPGMGNPVAINQLIAHHAVVFKPALQLVWISASPYQLGKFVAYDLNKIFSLTREQIISNHEIYTSELTIPADTFLNSKEYSGYMEYLRMSEELKKYSGSRRSLPSGFEEKYILTNPMFYFTYSQLADYYQNMKDYGRAYGYCQKALSMQVAGEDQKNELTRLSQNLLKRSKHADAGN